MRFVLVSTHVDQTTGYSKVVYNLLGQLSKLAPEVRTYHFGFQRHPERSNLRTVPKGVVSYDAAANEDPKEEGFGFNKIHEYLDMVNPDVVMIYNDPLIIHRFIEAMKYEKGVSPYKLWLYVDQVYEGIAPPLIESMNKHAERIYLFTNHWKNIYDKYAIFPDLRVIENAVDTTLFSKLPTQARLAIRQNIGIPQNGILIVNANRNTQRKRHDLAVMAFVQLHLREPENQYYMMILTGMNAQQGAYYDIARIYNSELARNGLGDREDLKKRLLLVDTSAKPLTDSAINELYNAADIGINTSDGEGFGLCQIEHLYTGAPQIVTDIGTYRDFMDDSVCEFVTSRSYSYFSGTMPLGQIAPDFSVSDLTSAMQRLIARLGKAKDAASSFKFKTWDEVCAGWIEDVKAETESK
jgi:glycosyltransferase involved in cell wall biosynthesis